MRRSPLAVLLTVPAFLAACSGSGGASDPVLPMIPVVSSAKTADGGKEHKIEMLDKCDPVTFNAMFGPGVCVSDHKGIPVQQFLATLAKNHSINEWRNDPQDFTAEYGETLVAINKGGEQHTFTRVAKFGGGIFDDLNALSGTPIPAPECLAAPPEEYINPGGSDTEKIETQGTALYQCCIHPWMRTTIKVKDKGK